MSKKGEGVRKFFKKVTPKLACKAKVKFEVSK